jgi:two-component system cell cycle response regulator DivK
MLGEFRRIDFAVKSAVILFLFTQGEARRAVAEIKILVVEDNEISMVLAHDLLKLRGYAVLKAYSAETAIQLARAEMPATIVMDIGLPKMDGLTATGVLKTDPATAAIPVIALTAHAMPGDEERARAAGCDGYLSKPIDVRRFFEMVARFAGAAAAEAS